MKRVQNIMAAGFILMAVGLLAAMPAQAGENSFRLPDYKTVTLDNGLTLIILEHHEVPLIHVSTLSEGGAIADGNHPGLARLTAESLMSGTRHLTREELETKLDFVGAEVRSSADKEFNRLTASFAAKDAAMMLPLLRDILLEPAFDGTEFTKYRERYLSRLVQQKESPRAVIGSYYDELIFRDHPYASPPAGDAESVEAVGPDDLKAFHAAIYQPQNTVVCVAGDFDGAKMEKDLKKLFAGWKKGDTEARTVATPEAPSKSRVLLVNKADANETTFYIGGPGVARTNPDFVGIQVVNTILGGRFTSWLNDELRVNAGLTYGARSRFTMYGKGGSFYISTFTRKATTFEAMDLALETYGRLWEMGVDTETLKSAKAYVKGQFPPRYETAGQLADLLVEMHAYGLGPEFINDFQTRVDALTVDEAARIVQDYFPRSHLQFVMIGQAAEIGEKAADYGEVIQVEIEQNGFSF